MGNSVKIIWGLFGDIRVEGKPNFHTDFRSSMTQLLKKYESDLIDKGYTLAVPKQYTTSESFWRFIQDPSTYGVILFSHAFTYKNTGVIAPAGWDERPILMKDAHGISKNLQFTALLGCKVGKNRTEWSRVLKLTSRFKQDYQKRFIAFDVDLPAHSTESSNRMENALDIIRNFLKNKGSDRDYHYNYPMLVEILPKYD